MEVPQNGWFIVEIPIKMDDLGAPPFQETSNCHSTVYNRKTCKTSIVVIVLITHFMKHISISYAVLNMLNTPAMSKPEQKPTWILNSQGSVNYFQNQRPFLPSMPVRVFGTAPVRGHMCRKLSASTFLHPSIFELKKLP